MKTCKYYICFYKNTLIYYKRNINRDITTGDKALIVPFFRLKGFGKIIRFFHGKIGKVQSQPESFPKFEQDKV